MGKVLPSATPLSLSESNLVSAPTPLLQEAEWPRVGGVTGPPHSPGSAAAHSYTSQGSLHSHRPDTHPSGILPHPGPGSRGHLLGLTPLQSPDCHWLCLPPQEPWHTAWSVLNPCGSHSGEARGLTV